MNGAAERAGGRADGQRREEQAAYLSRSRTLRSNYHLPHFPTSPGANLSNTDEIDEDESAAGATRRRIIP